MKHCQIIEKSKWRYDHMQDFISQSQHQVSLGYRSKMDFYFTDVEVCSCTLAFSDSIVLKAGVRDAG